MWGRGLVVAVALAMGCTASSAASAPSRSCPPCECECDCRNESNGPTGSSTAMTPSGGADVAALVRSATKKARARDGAGCLQDLDRAVKADPAMQETLLHMRGQCLMLVGRCEEGQRVARRGFQTSMGIEMDAERLDEMVESYAAMFCTGKVDDRMAVLRAPSNLQNAAYMAAKTPEYCRQQENAVRRHGARVKPKNNQDHRIRNLEQQLFALAPACYARAGDCTASYAAFKRLLPRESAAAFARMPAADRERTQRETFESMVERCAPSRP